MFSSAQPSPDAYRPESFALGGAASTPHIEQARRFSEQLYALVARQVGDGGRNRSLSDAIAQRFADADATEAGWAGFLKIVEHHGTSRTSLRKLARAFLPICRLELSDAVLNEAVSNITSGREHGHCLQRTAEQLVSVLQHATSEQSNALFVRYWTTARAAGSDLVHSLAEFKNVAGIAAASKVHVDSALEFAVKCYENNWSFSSNARAFVELLQAEHPLPPALKAKICETALEQKCIDGMPGRLAPSMKLAGLVRVAANAEMSLSLLNLYTAQGWPAEQVVKSLITILEPNGPADPAWNEHGAKVRLTREFVADHARRGWRMEIVLDRIATSSLSAAQLGEIIGEGMQHGLSTDYLPEAMLHRNTPIPLKHWQYFEGLYRQRPEGMFAQVAVLKEAMSRASTENSPPPPFDPAAWPPGMSAEDKVSAHLRNAALSLQEDRVEPLIVQLLRESNPVTRKVVSEAFQKRVRNDTVPYPLEAADGWWHPMAVQATYETRRVMYRAFDLYFGFGALTMETRRPDVDTPSSLVRFGLDVAERVSILNSKSQEYFPGNGVRIDGIRPDRVFAQDIIGTARGLDPYHLTREAMPWASRALDALAGTTFAPARGLLIVSGAREQDFEIKGTHYSYAVFNNHFHPNPGLRALLVPTDKLMPLIDAASIPVEDFAQYRPDRPEMTRLLAAPAFLHALGGDKIIDLGWASNLAGSLSNAFLPGSPCYHAWEDKLGITHPTRDIYGHVHKSYITGVYRSYMTPEMDALLEPLREAHRLVYRTATLYQSLFDLFRLSLSYWHKGFTLEAAEDSDEQRGWDGGGGEGVPEYIVPAPEGSAPVPISTRMLREAYRWHRSFGPNGSDERERCPVLTVAPVFNYWDKPASGVKLDTYSLLLRAGSEGIELPWDSDGTGPVEVEAWEKHVNPAARSASKDLRFFHRNVFM